MILELIATILSLVGSWMVYNKMGRQGWEGIVPIYNTYVLCQELYGNGWKFLLLLIPFYNIYFGIKMMIDLAKAFNLGAGFGIGLLLLPFVFWLILAFGGAQYKDGSYTNTQPDMVEDVVNKAKDVDVLDVAADMIGEIADEAQRKELGDLYHARREALSAS